MRLVIATLPMVLVCVIGMVWVGLPAVGALIGSLWLGAAIYEWQPERM